MFDIILYNALLHLSSLQVNFSIYKMAMTFTSTA